MTRTGLDEYLVGWAPQPETATDNVPIGPAQRLQDVLDLPPSTLTSVPPLWHWAYFSSWPPESELGEDGHPRDGRFLPPLPNRRRMWAGGSVAIEGALRFDTPTRRIASLQDAQVKHGRRGDMVLVTVKYEFEQDGATVVTERQDHVYRIGDDDAARPAWPARPTAPPDSAAPWQFPIVTDPVRLFRLSSLTANSHRIHYDAPYATGVEHYPGLVVHGPLLALHMAALAGRHDPAAALRDFTYRLQSPVFAGEPILAIGRPDDGAAELAVVSRPHTVHAVGRATYRRS